MSLKLYDRFTTLVRADAHGVVEALEERSLLLKQHLRDAELELVQKRARLEGLAAEEERLGERIERRREEIHSLDEDVELSLSGGKEDLARFAIKRLLPRRRELEALETARPQVRAAREQLAERLADQERELETLRDRVRARLATPEVGGSPEGPIVTEEEVELELLRRRGADAPAEGA